jgi:hypothetical protein
MVIVDCDLVTANARRPQIDACFAEVRAPFSRRVMKSRASELFWPGSTCRSLGHDEVIFPPYDRRPVWLQSAL